MIRQHCLLDVDDQRVCTAQLLCESLFVRDNVGRYGCFTVLNRSEIKLFSHRLIGLLPCLLLLSFVAFIVL